MSCKLVYDFVDPPDNKPPENAVVWTQLFYCDKISWYALPDNDKLEPKMTRFEEKRFLFLDPVEATPPEIQKMLSGEYDVKTWEKEKCILSIEAEKMVYIKLPKIEKVITYNNSTRLPTFTRLWKPTVFLINETTYTIRLTEEIALIITRADENTTEFNVYSVGYNSGFCCAHPTSSYGLAYGGYVVKTLKNCIEIPHIDSTKGPWGFLMQFYTWGGLVIPKEIELSKPSSLIGSITGAHKTDKIGIIFHPPNIFLHLHLDAPPKTCRTLTHGKDFVITAKKESSTDINIYLLIDGQLVLYNYSFDLRINKQGGNKVNQMIKFKAHVEKEEKTKLKPKFIFKESKEMRIPVAAGSPTSELNFLISEEVIAIFDAEISQYSTHPAGMKKCGVFKKLAVTTSN